MVRVYPFKMRKLHPLPINVPKTIKEEGQKVTLISTKAYQISVSGKKIAVD